MVDVESSETRRLTHDTWAEVEPAWSPDGRSIALVTDRYAPDSTGSGSTRGATSYNFV